jgi:hypothetical protein
MKKEEIIETITPARAAKITKKVKITMVCDCCNKEFPQAVIHENCHWCGRDLCTNCALVLDWPGDKDSCLVLCKNCDSNYGELFMDECHIVIRKAIRETEDISAKYSKLAKDRKNKDNG